MEVWFLMGVIWLCTAAPEDCIDVRAEPALGLDSALAATASLPSVILCLTPAAVSFTLGTSVDSQVTIAGNNQSITLLKMIKVRGSLTILNSTLTAKLASTESSAFSLLGGFLHLENSLIDSIEETLITGSGVITLKDNTIRNSIAPIVSIDYREETTVQILKCEVWNHTGEFLRVFALVYSGNFFLTVAQSVFRENRGSGYLVSYSAPLLSGNFSISDTEFTSNSVSLFSFDIGEVQASIARCQFTGNNQTTATIYAKGSMFTIEDSFWSGNSQIVFDLRQFTGDLLVSRMRVTDQRWKGIFQIRNSLSPDQCRFTLQDSSFLDTYFKVNETSPGIVNANGCMMQAARTVIDNVRMAAVRQRDLEGLMCLRFGALAISHLTLRSSGAVATALGVVAANFTLTDSCLHEAQSGGGLYAIAWVSRIAVHNVSVTQGAKFPLDEANINTVTMYFIASSSHMEVRNVSILPSKWSDRADPFVAFFSTVDIAEVSVLGHRYESIGYFIEAEGAVSNVTISDCVMDVSIFYVDNYQLLRVTGVRVRDSTVGLLFNHGILAGSPSMVAECADFTANNVTANYFLASKHAQVSLRNIAITDSHFKYFMKNQLDSDIYIENMAVRRSTAVLAFLYRCSLRIANSTFEDFESNSVIIGGENVNLTLDRVVIKNASSPLGFSRFKERSQLIITNCTFAHYQSTAEEGFYHSTGSLSITDSTFRSFNTVFIQARSCSVYIGNSVFQEGRSKALSRTSASAYGGALGCTDCPSVAVENSSFLNVSAIFGGAIAVRSSSGTLSVSILYSEFVLCAATSGGAVYVKASSCYIEGSKFIGNEATSTGGAIEAATENSTLVRDSMFFRNSALEGGAVKWTDAEVAFINVSFQDNSATYGPDIASYGVKLSGAVYSSSGAEASGYPLQLLFELQDHYGQRVTTALTQDLQLSSSDEADFLGNVVTTIDHGIFNFSQLTIYARPNSTQEISGATTTTQNGRIVTINASVEIDFRDCVPGEVRKDDRCEYCFAGRMSFSPSDSNCSFCPKHSFCPGGSVLLVDPHYWRSSTNSTEVLQCPVELSCLGGQYSECAEGYTGQVCNQCSQGYTRHRTIECEPCGNRILQWIKMCLITVPIIGFYKAVGTSSDIRLFVLKQAINHAQLLSTLSYIRVSYPPVIKHMLHSLSYVSSLFITELPASCFSSKQSEYIKAIIGSSIPLVINILFVLLNCGNMKKAIVLCTSSMMFTSMISLATEAPLLACQSEWLFVDMQERCWEGRHLLLAKALVLPSVIVNVALPIALVVAVSIVSPQKFDDLFPLWRSGVNWRCWEVLMYSAKGALICLVVVSITIGQLCQVTYGLVVLIFVSVFAVGLHTCVYSHWKLFSWTEYSLVIVAVSMGLCAFFIYHPSTKGLTAWVVAGLFLTVNLGYFAVCVKLWISPPNLNSKASEQKAEEVSPYQFAPPHNSMIEFLH